MRRSILLWLSLLWRPRALWCVIRLLWLLLRLKAMNFFSPGAIDEQLRTMEGQLQADEIRKSLARKDT